jgi:L-xylulokinase
LAFLEIEELFGTLPRLMESTDVCGKISRDASEETGLCEGIPVIAGLADIDACALGSGVIHRGDMCIISGTWSINEALTDKFIARDDIFGVSLYAIPDLYLLLEASPTSAGNLSWCIDTLFPSEKASCEKTAKSIYEFCDEMVESCPIDENQLLFHPFLYGSDKRADASAAFLGLKGWLGRQHMIRSVYEGVAFAHRMHIDRLRKMSIDEGVVRLTGGASRSDVWAQILSDVLNMRLERTTDTELGTKGCMICGAVGMGLYKNFLEAVTTTITRGEIFEPQDSMMEHYEKNYSRFLGTLQKMDAVWDALAQ